MSAASETYQNDIDYGTQFPPLGAQDELFDKPKGTHAEKGRRCGAEKMYARLESDRAILSKTVHDPQQVLGKRRKARLLSSCQDNLECGVLYSVNKNNRWDQVDAATLLKDADTSEVDVAVVEKTLSHKDVYFRGDNKMINAVHLMDKEGNITSKSAKGKGAKAADLLSGDNKSKKRGERVSSVGETESESEKEEQERARIEYRISTPHTNSRMLMGKVCRRYAHKDQRSRRNKTVVDMSELELSDMEVSIHIEENDVYKPSRDFRFSLADYMTKPKTEMSVVRSDSSDSLKQVEIVEKEEVGGARPMEVIDISAVTKTPSIFEAALINTSTWNDYNFAKQVESLSSSGRYVVRWLDANHQRASVDISPKTEGPEAGATTAIVVLEKCRKNAFRIVFNCSIAASGPFSSRTLKNLLLSRAEADSIEKAVDFLASMVNEWKKRDDRTGASAIATAFRNSQKFYQPSVNSKSMANTAHAASSVQMADLLRHYASISESEPFERIDDDDFETCSQDSSNQETEEEEPGFETNLTAPSKVKCISCVTSSMEDLFELDDCWQCRECLRRSIINLIRTKNIPLEIPFIADVGGSVYDVLPALIPLPLIAYYTKMAATELMQLCTSEIGDLLDCPGCRQTVKVERPNEFHTCRCSWCGVLWCGSCRAEPHWPVTCEKYAQWMDKWMQQYPFEALDHEISQNLHRVACKCGDFLEFGDKSEAASLVCQCGREIIQVQYMNQGKKEHFYYFKGRQDSIPKMTELPIVHHIRKEFAKPCAEARQLRFNKIRSGEIAKQCRRATDREAVANLPNLRTTVLYLVEMGLAWLYMNKSGPQGIKNQLLQLLKMLGEVELELESNKSTLAERIAALESALEKVKDSLKNASAVI